MCHKKSWTESKLSCLRPSPVHVHQLLPSILIQSIPSIMPPKSNSSEPPKVQPPSKPVGRFNRPKLAQVCLLLAWRCPTNDSASLPCRNFAFGHKLTKLNKPIRFDSFVIVQKVRSLTLSSPEDLARMTKCAMRNSRTSTPPTRKRALCASLHLRSSRVCSQ